MWDEQWIPARIHGGARRRPHFSSALLQPTSIFGNSAVNPEAGSELLDRRCGLPEGAGHDVDRGIQWVPVCLLLSRRFQAAVSMHRYRLGHEPMR